MEFYNKYQLQHPNVKISLRGFEGLKPWFVCKRKVRYTCCCIVHVQMMYLKQALSHIRQKSKGLHGIECACMCVSYMSKENLGKFGAHMHLVIGINTLCEAILCAQPGDYLFHSLSCLMGDCQQYGPSRLVMSKRKKW